MTTTGGRVCSIEGCNQVHKGRGYCRLHLVRWRLHGSPLTVLKGGGSRPGPRPGARKAVVSYLGAHKRVWRAKGKAVERACTHCEAPAQEWAYNHADPNELIGEARPGLEVAYSLDPAFYIPLCKPCHARFDQKAAV